jgi:hypothetical protein
MKIIIGISSITLIGIFYSIIKKFFSPKKLIEGNNNQTNQQIVLRNNKSKIVEGNNHDTELLNSIFEQLKSLNKTQNDISEMYIKYYNIEHQYLSETLVSKLFLKTTIYLSSIDTGVNNESWVFELGNDDTSGFRVFNNVCEVKLLSARIPKGNSYTNWVDITIEELPSLYAHMIKDNKDAHTIKRIYLDNDDAATSNASYTNYYLNDHSEKLYLSGQNIPKLTIKFYNDNHGYHDIGTTLDFSLELSITELNDIGHNYFLLLEKQIERNKENRERLTESNEND